jgi:hypothetical protein
VAKKIIHPPQATSQLWRAQIMRRHYNSYEAKIIFKYLNTVKKFVATSRIELLTPSLLKPCVITRLVLYH